MCLTELTNKGKAITRKDDSRISQGPRPRHTIDRHHRWKGEGIKVKNSRNIHFQHWPFCSSSLYPPPTFPSDSSSLYIVLLLFLSTLLPFLLLILFLLLFLLHFFCFPSFSLSSSFSFLPTSPPPSFPVKFVFAIVFSSSSFSLFSPFFFFLFSSFSSSYSFFRLHLELSRSKHI